MAWVWYDRLDTSFEPAVFDYGSPVTPTDAMTDIPIDESRGRPVLRAESSLIGFESLHCPPTGDPPAVDDVWQDIILKFVPQEFVQFYPITIAALDGTTKKFSWVLPFNRVRCIDPERSGVVRKVQGSNVSHIISCNFYVHYENCLGNIHLARDEQQLNHIVLSDELRNALAETGESSMFFQPADLPIFLRRTVN